MSQKIQAPTSTCMGHGTLFSDAPDSVEEFGEGIDF